MRRRRKGQASSQKLLKTLLKGAGVEEGYRGRVRGGTSRF